MRITLTDLRTKLPEILQAIDRHETVTLLIRGKPRAVLGPTAESTPEKGQTTTSLKKHPAFGMWKDRPEMEDVQAYVRKLRRGRVHDL